MSVGETNDQQAPQHALFESERRFRLLVESVVDYAIFMLDPTGIVVNWNPGARRIKGYTADEIIGQHFSRFYPESDRAAGVPARSLRTAGEEGRFEAEGWRVRKDGTLFRANVVIDAIRDEQGELIGFAKITRDITERVEAQKALRETQAQLAQSQKMEALGQLTGGVAHDFNNLLMIVHGHIQTIRRFVGENPKALHAVEAIELAAKRGDSLTRQLLTFSRRQNLNPVVIDPHEAIDDIRTMLTSSIGETVKLVSSVAPDVGAIEADPGELELAVVNLVVNARDAMPQGGVVTITAENVRLGPGDTPAKLDGEFVALSVADTGCGIPEDILSKIFDPFFTTKGSDKGTGLGLSQAHGFAHQSGGTIVVRTTINEGTCVTIYLPRAGSAPAAGRVTDQLSGQAAHGKALLVDDNLEVLQVSKGFLEQLGYQVVAVADAPAALKEIGRTGFDLVLSDIVMTGAMNGLGLARALRERQPDLPIILATGYSDLMKEAAGEFVVLRKPYQLAELSRAVVRLAGLSRQPTGGSNLVSFRDAKRNRATRADTLGA